MGPLNYTNPDCFYSAPMVHPPPHPKPRSADRAAVVVAASGEIHSVELTDLKAATRYTYSCGSDSRQFTFKTPPAVAPTASIKLAVVGDLGQTENSSATMELMEAELQGGNVDLILHAGDLAYADGNGLRWDSYGRLGEKLFAAVPTGEHPCLALIPACVEKRFVWKRSEG